MTQLEKVYVAYETYQDAKKELIGYNYQLSEELDMEDDDEIIKEYENDLINVVSEMNKCMTIMLCYVMTAKLQNIKCEKNEEINNYIKAWKNSDHKDILDLCKYSPILLISPKTYFNKM